MNSYTMLDAISRDPALSNLSSLSSLNIQIGTKLKAIEKMVILETLRHQKYNRTKTAGVLGIGIRTLQRKLKQYSAETNGETAHVGL
ncbi:helix-turn-helix domain-containing protein [bacterium]|nr:helix-turn-helix domain-containing protein [bacterium]